eukprot:1029840-Pleurochrysis_carterae.AAC.1
MFGCDGSVASTRSLHPFCANPPLLQPLRGSRMNGCALRTAEPIGRVNTQHVGAARLFIGTAQSVDVGHRRHWLEQAACEKRAATARWRPRARCTRAACTRARTHTAARTDALFMSEAACLPCRDRARRVDARLALHARRARRACHTEWRQRSARAKTVSHAHLLLPLEATQVTAHGANAPNAAQVWRHDLASSTRKGCGGHSLSVPSRFSREGERRGVKGVRVRSHL